MKRWISITWWSVNIFPFHPPGLSWQRPPAGRLCVVVPSPEPGGSSWADARIQGPELGWYTMVYRYTPFADGQNFGWNVPLRQRIWLSQPVVLEKICHDEKGHIDDTFYPPCFACHRACRHPKSWLCRAACWIVRRCSCCKWSYHMPCAWVLKQWCSWYWRQGCW